MSDTGISVATGDPTVDSIVAGGGFAGGMDDGPVGGMFSGPTGPLDPMTGEFVGPHAPREEDGIATYYRAQDVETLWRALPLEDRVRLQDSLVALGLARQVIPGEFDDGTVDGLTRLLSLSNRAGTRWQATIGRLRSLEEQGLLEGEQQQYEPAPRLTPDYDALAQDVKATFRQRLGRDPDDYELQQLTGALTGFYANEHEAAEELRRIQHEQATRPGVQVGGTVQGVDPMAKFRQMFEQQYDAELDFVEDKQQAAETEQIMQQTANTVSRAARTSF